ncbi:MAG: hypothetical protein KGL39_48930 [Patescibacteria group bacterium]|nr:hypothetical protein [Patescibacteria group bacterium]
MNDNLTPKLTPDQMNQNIDALLGGGMSQADVQTYVNRYSKAADGSYQLSAAAPQPEQPGDGAPIAPWFPASPSDNALEAGLKTFGNLIPSAVNTGAGMIKSTVETPELLGSMLSTASDTGNVYDQAQRAHDAALQGANDLVAAKKAKGLDTTLDEQAVREIEATPVPERGLETLKAMPGAALTVLQGILPFLKPAMRGDISGTAAQFENNPVGNVLPVVAAAEAGVRGLANGGIISNDIPAAVDAAISRTGQAVTRPAAAVADFLMRKGAEATRFGTSQATGFNPETVSKIVNNRGAFTPEAMAGNDRLSVARQVENAGQQRLSDLSETGKAYAPFRKMQAPVRVDPDFLTNLFEKNTGLTVQEAPAKAPAPREPGVIQMEAPAEQPKAPGKLVSSPDASVRDSGDVSRLQKIYNTYQPLFQNGSMTPNQFLNLRSDLADAANFETKMGKSAPVEQAAAGMRAQLNDKYRPQIPGLEAQDAKFSGQIEETKGLLKGLLDRNGNLTDAAINRVANAAGKGKDLLLGRLEQLVPGITEKIGIVKAIEDIQHSEGPKVGTYARGSAGPAAAVALFTGHPYLAAGAIAEAILSSPKFAVPILRAYGATADVTAAVLKTLKGYLNPSLTGPVSIPFMPRSNGEVPNPASVK